MKEFIRLIITLIVLLIVFGTIYYVAVIHGKSDVVDENNIVVNDNSNDVELIEKEETNVSENQDVIVNFEQTQVLTMNMGTNLLGSSVEEFLTAFEISETPVLFQKIRNNDGVKITIIPMSDFLDNQEFEYDVNGNLISYTTISNTVGGNVKYFFSNNILSNTVNNMEEGIVPIFEDQNEILARASKLYNL